MEIKLKPELERFVDDQIREGRFSSATEVLEAGLARLLLDPEPDNLDSSDLIEIRESIEEMRRGEVLDWKIFSAQLPETLPRRVILA
jgi:putative addiction module CopG family antidote